MWLVAAPCQTRAEAVDPPFQQTAESESAERPIVYQPPMRGEPTSRVGGATRGLDLKDSGNDEASAEALAPADIALTLSEQPTLYWYLSSPAFVRIEVALDTGRYGQTLLQVDYPQALEPGIHAVSLADHNVVLALETDYRWSVRLSGRGFDAAGLDDGDDDASAPIRRVMPSRSLTSELSQGGGVPRYYILAEHGIWYDALHDLSEAMRQAPENDRLRARWVDLLKQVGLSEAAAFESR